MFIPNLLGFPDIAMGMGSSDGGGETPFSPSDIPGLILWLDASDASTIQQSGGFVSQWSDKSGAGNHATQATGSRQPQTGVATINGQNALALDGVDDGLSLPASLYDLLGSSPVTVFVVGQSNNVGDATQTFLSGNVGSFRRHGIYTTAANYNYFNRSSLAPTMITQARDAAPHLMGFYRDGTQLVPWLDGIIGNNIANSEDIVLTSLTIGANSTFASERLNGCAGAIYIFNRALTNAELNQMSGYIAAKWSLTAPTFATTPLFGRRKTTVVFGDSITAGVAATTADNRWANKVANSVGATLLNQGIGGTFLQNSNDKNGNPTLNNGRDRYVTALTGANKRDLCIIQYGFNDMRYTPAPASVNVANYQNDLSEIVTGLIGTYGYSADDIIIATPPWLQPNGFTNASADFVGSNDNVNQTYGAAARAVAVANGTYFANTYQALKDVGIPGIDTDLIHPNDFGMQAIYNAIMAAAKVS